MLSDNAFEVAEADFEQVVVAPSFLHPVIVMFRADACEHSKVLLPILEAQAERLGHFRLVTVNADQNQNLARECRVRGVPAVKVFSQGRIVDEFAGALPEAKVHEFLFAAVPTPAGLLRQRAHFLLDAGQPERARQELEKALQLDPDNGLLQREIAALAVMGQANRRGGGH